MIQFLLSVKEKCLKDLKKKKLSMNNILSMSKVKDQRIQDSSIKKYINRDKFTCDGFDYTHSYKLPEMNFSLILNHQK